MSGPVRIDIEPVSEATPEIRALIGALDAELSVSYTPEQRHGIALQAIFQPHVTFFLARWNGTAVGCGGVALFDAFAEVKRMYVRDAARGRGVAAALLAAIEAAARAAGHTILRLETGVHQPAALRFYTRAGFSPCAIFGDYVDMATDAIATSVFMEKRI